MRLRLPALAAMIGILPVGSARAQDVPAGPSLGDWVEARMDAACPNAPFTLFAGVGGQVLQSKFRFPLSQYKDALPPHEYDPVGEPSVTFLPPALFNRDGANSTDRLNAAHVELGTPPFYVGPALPQTIDKGSAVAFNNPAGGTHKQDWSFLTAAPAVTVGCDTEDGNEFYAEYRFLGGSGGGNDARIHTTHGGWRTGTSWKRLQISWGAGLRADVGDFNVRTPVFYYGAGASVAAADFPFAQEYHKGFFAVGPEGEFGLAWEAAPLAVTYFVRARAAGTLGNERTVGLLTQDILGPFHFDYEETSVLLLFDVKAGFTWRPRFLAGFQLSAGGVLEGGPSTYSSAPGEGFYPSVLEGAFVESAYLF